MCLLILIGKKIISFKTCLLFFIVICSCGSFINKGKNKIHGVRVTHLFPWIDENGKLENYDTMSSCVYYYKNQILCYSSYKYDSSSNGQRIKPITRFYYFVFTKGNKYGYLFDANKEIFARKLPTDSVLKNESWYNNEFYNTLNKSREKMIIKDSYNKDLGILKKDYRVKGRENIGELATGVYDTFCFDFTNKFKDVEYSLSKQFDSITKMKLTKIRIINSPLFIKDYNITLDRIEQMYWLDEIKINNTEELIKYFEEDDKHNKVISDKNI